MAGRPIGRRHQDDIRAKIRVALLVKFLEDHALGLKRPGKAVRTRLKAAEILLRKCLPDQSQVEHSGEIGGTVKLVRERDAKRVA